jgi:probable HAF family extracellular repeat protein
MTATPISMLRYAIQVLCFLTLTASGLAQTYTITDLGNSDDWYSETHGMNSSGGVVGEFEVTNSISVGAFWFHDGSRTDLGHLAGTPYAIAWAVNTTNQIVGESNMGFDTHAFLYTNGVMSDLGTLGGSFTGGYSSAHAINGSGQIVGESSTSFMSANTIHAVLYNGTTKTDLGAIGGNYSSANGINSAGVVVGESDVVQAGVTNVHAFVYTNSPMKDLGTLGGAYSSAKGINDSATIVGESDEVISGVTYLRGFIYRNGSMTGLGTLGGNTSSASAINNSGMVVGYATDTNEVSCAFLYDGSNMINLLSRIPPGSPWTNLTSADVINDAGQIAGSGYLSDGSYHAYLLTPSGPLAVSITNPPAKSNFAAPATLVIGATVTDTAGTVTNVQFKLNNSIIGNAASAPYGATVTSLGAGSYTLTALAFDSVGFKATNTIAITVLSGLPTISISNAIYSVTNFSFSFNTQTGYTYDGQFTMPLASSNAWLSFTNLAGDGSVVRITDTTPTNAQRYYRVIAH